ncbi:cadmium resistance transporter [Microbispora sp. NPDC049633]|uniref:cadmium resistance transporter n=1 Tax=Microbispora sp. NPDC049633 TaxID=3154355 RepID=UPI00341A1745
MDGVLGTASTAGAVFAGTNIDDIIILTVLFLSARANGKPRPWQIVTGQYVGITALVAVSVIAALGLTIIPDQWVGLLGLVPLALGVWGLIKAIRAKNSDDEPPSAVASGLLSVASVTVANGADNISVYTPMFRTIGVSATLITIAIFSVLVALWCLVGSLLGSHKKIIEFVERYGHWLVPFVFIAIGTVIVLESGVISHLIDLL